MIKTIYNFFCRKLKRNPNAKYLTHTDPLIRTLAQNEDLKLIHQYRFQYQLPQISGMRRPLSLWGINYQDKLIFLEVNEIGKHYLDGELKDSGIIYRLFQNLDQHFPQYSNTLMETPYIDPIIKYFK